MSTEPTVTETTRQKIDRWTAAVNRLERATQEINSLGCEVANARNDLGKFLVPAGHDEPFNIWFGNGILRATREKNENYVVEWLRKPTCKQALTMDIR